MPRSTGRVASRRRRKRILKDAKGYKGGRSRLFRTAVEAVRKGLMYSFAHRRKKKGDFRKLWIVRIKIATEARGLKYSRFIYALEKANIDLNRKMLADMAVNDTKGFDAVFEKAKVALTI
jgi:large subunit ribosomal protein L20